ncbi:MAG: hypothetical protein DRJ38_06640 [Thermoprotei archaeon]|nr:MAG: hypothetical protein DRJ38_06640 [Thermoprotei archaeon]
MESKEELLRRLFRSEGRREILRIIAREGILTTSEIVRRTGLRRQTVVEYLKEFEDLGLIKVKKDQKPWIVLASEELKLLPLEGKIEERKIEFKYSWSDFPTCLYRDGRLDLVFVWGSGRVEKAEALDAVGIPEVVVKIFSHALSSNIPRENISIVSSTDVEVLENKKLLSLNLFVIGSGIVNLLTAKIMEELQPPIRFEPPMGRDIYSTITEKFYSAGDEPDKYAGILALLPNPWNPGRVVILVGGIFKQGTMAALKALIRHLDEPPFLQPHPIAGIPIRVVRADEHGDLEGFFE